MRSATATDARTKVEMAAAYTAGASLAARSSGERAEVVMTPLVHQMLRWAIGQSECGESSDLYVSQEPRLQDDS